MEVAPKVYHLHLLPQKRWCDLDPQELCHLRRPPVSGHELDTLILVAQRADVTCFVGRADRSRDFGWFARLAKSNTIYPIVWNIHQWKSTSQKLDM